MFPSFPSAWLVESDASLRPSDEFEGSPLLAPALRLLYCGVPKVATTVLKRLLLRINGLPTWNSDDGTVVHKPALSGIPTMRGMSAAAANVLLHDAAWTRFVVVRDPVERFASAFLDKCRTTNLSFACPVPPGDAAHNDPLAVLAALEARVDAHGDSPHREEVAAAYGGTHASTRTSYRRRCCATCVSRCPRTLCSTSMKSSKAASRASFRTCTLRPMRLPSFSPISRDGLHILLAYGMAAAAVPQTAARECATVIAQNRARLCAHGARSQKTFCGASSASIAQTMISLRPT